MGTSIQIPAEGESNLVSPLVGSYLIMDRSSRHVPKSQNQNRDLFDWFFWVLSERNSESANHVMGISGIEGSTFGGAIVKPTHKILDPLESSHSRFLSIFYLDQQSYLSSW